MNREYDNLITMGKGTPVLLLHSAMSSKLQWYKLMQSMSRNHLMIAVDFYGYGDSPFPRNTENFSLSDEIALLESLLKNVIPPHEPFHIVGHSYGGAVALRYCYKAEERVRSLTLYEPVAFHLLRQPDEKLFAQVLHQEEIVSNLVKLEKYAEAAEHFIDRWNGAGTFSGYPKEVQILLCQSVKKLPLGFRALVEEPLTLEDYSRFKVPVCIIAGQRSPIDSRRVAELLAEHLIHCQLNWIDADHMAPVAQPGLVNPIIETFIGNVK